MPTPEPAPESDPDSALESPLESPRGPDPDRVLTWASLLARWIDFARGAAALPADADGRRWRSAVPSIIELHALALALDELIALPERERDVARDRASVQIAAAAARLSALWHGEEFPAALRALRDDALDALARAAWAGARELRWDGPGALVMPELPATAAILAGEDSAGTYVVAPPGTLVMPGAPAAWWIGRGDPSLPEGSPGLTVAPISVPRQVYRALDEAGCAVEDVMAPMTAPLLPGLPLLVALLERGTRVGSFPLPREAWAELQRRAVGERLLPVRHFEPGGTAEGRR
ncbi:MAG TPA: hypothetical protein PKC43_04405 [Phycisphaerales bacterium]|nr:hypothetical protein [Phycisphaerales bacterium]HMP36670.1 hypothetical protein [Phycisphaerales bacterium]